MSLATPFYPSPPALRLRTLVDPPDLLLISPVFCGRCTSSNAGVGICLSPTLCSPRSCTAYADNLSRISKLHIHRHLCRTPSLLRTLSSLGSDGRIGGKEDRVIASGPPEVGAANKGLLARKRPAKLAIPESARLASLHKAKQFILPEQQSSYSQEAELFAVAAKKGYKDYMEDSYSASTHLQGASKQAFFGVFDGHGGKQAAQFVAENLSQHISAALQNQMPGMTYLEDAMHTAYRRTDEDFLNQHTSSGACAVTVLMKEGEMIVSNAGDCKAVLCRGGEAECLSTVHRASNEVERQRIEDLGGFVECRNGTWRLQGSLAVTRGFGDAALKQWVSAEPATKRNTITSDYEFLILASDGLWDQLSEQEAVDCARKAFLGIEKDDSSDFSRQNKQVKLQASTHTMNACEELVRVACSRGNRDDITVMIVPLKRFAVAEQ